MILPAKIYPGIILAIKINMLIYTVCVKLMHSALFDRWKSSGTKSETEILRGYAHKYLGEVMTLLGEVPADLLLLLKTNDCLRHLDKSLGAPINSAIGKKI